MLQKSVISVADHYEKTRRYYDLIGQSNRCVALESVGEDDVISMISEYCDCPIIIPEDVKEISKMHYNKLVEFLNLCSKK